MITLEKINNHVVTPIEVNKVDPDKIKGYDLIPKLYCTIFVCAKKESGKTNVIFKILKTCSNKKTKLFLISSTIFNDENWIKICEYFENKGNEVHQFTSLDEANLKLLTENLEKEAQQEIQENKKSEVVKPKLILFDDSEKTKQERKPKKIAPEIIFVFDDMSSELRDKDLSKLIKNHRHFKTKIILSSQYPNDLAPEARKNIDFWILFAGHSENKLLEIYSNANLNISFPLFMQLYQNATSKKYNFLFVDKNKDEFRRNFNLKYNILSD